MSEHITCRSLTLVDTKGVAVASLSEANGVPLLVVGRPNGASVCVTADDRVANIDISGSKGRGGKLSLVLDPEGVAFVTAFDASGLPSISLATHRSPGLSVYRDGKPWLELELDADRGMLIIRGLGPERSIDLSS